MSVPSIGTKGRTVLAVAGSAIASLVDGDIGTGTANNGRAVEHLQNTLGLSQQMVRTNGMRGDVDHHGDRTRYNIRNVGGRIVLAPSPTELSNLRAILFGTSGALTTAGPIEFDAFVDRDQRRFIYTGCRVTRAEFRSATGGMLSLTLDIVAKDETNVATALPALAIPSQAPMMHHDSANAIILNSGGSTALTLEPTELMWAINHVMKEDCYYNSLTRTVIPQVDRVVDVMTVVPYNDLMIAAGLHEMPYAGFGATTNIGRMNIGYTAVETGNIGFSCILPKVKWSRQSPEDDGRTEIMLSLAGQAFKLTDAGRPIESIAYVT